MAPFAGNAIGSVQHLAINDDTAAYAGTENNAEDTVFASRRTVAGFGQRKAVGVVGQPHFALEQCLQVAFQRLADQAGRIGILD